MMASIFTRIIQGELPSYKIYEDELIFAFLALDQVNPGHTLVIPKQEINSWLDVPSDVYARLHHVSQKIGGAIKKYSACPRVGQMVAGFEVPHYHLHLIPAWGIPDLDFRRAKKLSPEEMKNIQEGILAHLN